MKKYLLGLFAVALAIGFSAFTTPIANKGKFIDYDYFSYSPTVYTEASYETAGSWTFSDNNPGDLCSGANNKPCVVRVDETLISAQTNTAFATYLASLVGANAAKAYCEDYTNNAIHKKP